MIIFIPKKRVLHKPLRENAWPCLKKIMWPFLEFPDYKESILEIFFKLKYLCINWLNRWKI